MTKRSAQHATFTIERDFAAAPARVYKAFADQKEKDKWFEAPTNGTGTNVRWISASAGANVERRPQGR